MHPLSLNYTLTLYYNTWFTVAHVRMQIQLLYAESDGTLLQLWPRPMHKSRKPPQITEAVAEFSFFLPDNMLMYQA